MITLDRKTGAVLQQTELTEEQRKQLARAFAARVLPQLQAAQQNDQRAERHV